ncbi:MAG: Clp protease ClpP [Alphaproteobacteria bacterium]|nr:Clp protease ClpP [Alphaproteobacteria bacterium]
MPVLRDGELYLYGFVGDSFWDEGFTASEVQDALIMLGRDAHAVVHLNSGGGYVDQGVAIYNAFIAHRGKVTIKVEGLAASAASVIFMAGEERLMNTGAMLMIHDPSSIVFGTAADMAKKRDMLDKIANELASIYADRTGDNVEAIRDEMRDEIWLTGDEAIDRGFATGVADQDAEAVTAFDYRVYAHAPADLRALAQTNSWSLPAAPSKANGMPTRVPNAGMRPVDTRGVNSGVPIGGRHQPQEEENSMPANNGKPAATILAGITDAAMASIATQAVEAASIEGNTAGREAERERLTGILNADDIKGDGKRMSAALDLASKSSAMSAEDVVAFVTGNVAEASAEADPAAAYEASRTSASGLASPAPAPKSQGRSLNSSAIYDARRKQGGKE